MEQQTGSNLGKEYIKAVYCHPANLTYMQNTPCEMPGWIFTISYWQLKKTWEMIMLVFVFMLVVEYMCMCLVVSDSATMDCSPPGSSVQGILQARILDFVAMLSSRGSFWPRDGTQISHVADRFFTICALERFFMKGGGLTVRLGSDLSSYI